MKGRRAVLIAVILIGGLAVLASYVHGFVTHPDIRWDVWGGIPGSLRPVYTVAMVMAAIGFFPFTLYILLRLDPTEARVLGSYGYSVFITLYVSIMAGSAVWMPLTYAMISGPDPTLWTGIRVALGVVAVGSVGLLGAIVTATPVESPGWRRAAIAGCVLFNFQTVVLDAFVWTAYFPY